MNSNSLFFIVGPTAVGKSDLAAQAAHRSGGIVLNADSVQNYQEVMIGAAKPGPELQALARHVLFDWVKAGEELTAADYRREALSVIAHEIQHHPIFAVGGSGFYIRALENGMYPVPEVAPSVKEQVLAELAAEGPQRLHEKLKALDSEFAMKLAPADGYRIQRALCVIRSQGRTMTEVLRDFSDQAAASKLPYPIVKVGLTLDRELLRERITRRTENMLRAGLLDEVSALLRMGLRDWPPLSSVGYRECVTHLEGGLALNDLASAITLSTMQLAKKQMTWFKRDKEIQWFDAGVDMDQALRYMLTRLD